MLEFYEAYGDYNSVAALTRELVQGAALATQGSTTVRLADGSDYDLGGEWAEISMYDSLSESLGEPVTPETSIRTLRGYADALEVGYDPAQISHGKLVELLWEAKIGDDLWAPTFVRDFPVETSPLTREHRSIAGVVEKWDLYVRGVELATGYSELVDPVIAAGAVRGAGQAGRAAAMRRPCGSTRTSCGRSSTACPRPAGMGMGIDRLLMALTGAAGSGRRFSSRWSGPNKLDVPWAHERRPDRPRAVRRRRHPLLPRGEGNDRRRSARAHGPREVGEGTRAPREIALPL